MFNRILIAVAGVILTTPLSVAAPIDHACLSSGRSQGNARLCHCIQQVADQTLSSADQRRAARFFRDPHQAQEVRMSGAASDNAFWSRYTKFAWRAEENCS